MHKTALTQEDTEATRVIVRQCVARIAEVKASLLELKPMEARLHSALTHKQRRERGFAAAKAAMDAQRAGLAAAEEAYREAGEELTKATSDFADAQAAAGYHQHQ